MNCGVRRNRGAGAMFQHVMENFEGPLRGLLPTEMGGALQSETLGTRAELAIDQQIGERTDNLVDRVGVEQDRRAVYDLRYAEVCEQATARPHAIASSAGSPKPS